MKKRKKSIFKHQWQAFCLTVIACTLTLWGSPASSQESETEITAITTEEPEIPVDELKLLLKPLTQEELEVEAKAWQNLLKAKVQEISDAEIAIKRKNRETRKSEEAVDAIEKAQKSLEEAEAGKKSASPSSPEAEEAEKNLEAAQKELAKAQEAVEEAVEVKKQSEGTEEATQNLEVVAEAIEDEASNTDDIDSQQELAEKEKQLEALSQQLEDSSEEASEVKTQLVVGVTELQQEQTALADRFDTVLDEFESKGGQAESFRQYIESVSGLEIDVSDTEGLWLRIAGWLKSEEGGLRWGKNIGIFSAIVVTSVIVAAILGFVTNRSLRIVGGVSDPLRQLLVRTVWQTTVGVGVLLALTALEINLGPILALVGGTSFILAFALQTNIGNLASGLMIMVYSPFNVGDEVELCGTSGYIDSISLAHTKVKGWTGQIITIPNNSVLSSVVINHNARDTRRISLQIRVGYSENLSKVEQLLLDIFKSHPLVLDQPGPSTFAWKFEEYFVELYVGGWTKTSDYWGVYNETIHQIKERFVQEGISIPVPQQDIRFQESTQLSFKPQKNSSSVGQLSSNDEQSDAQS
ncbi:mechanosensitive ion channel family protein [Okeania sp. SIO2C9]|uniref:mechanosensitive ion channel family protein n=1 Tax=Okeania sp. SIO2C9 TaxID=2607791 RepID=UPI0025F0E083|nr:mechanosensitive ion channel domain-containing protein [Okeania sp. SIO2C9]